jgi:secondary thiamine-phosphate synthase enzyme
MPSEFSVSTGEATSVHDVTAEVESRLPSDANGTWTVFVEHTTAGLTLQEAESRLMTDIADALEDVVADEGWQHDRLDDNADGHIRATLVGSSVTVPVSNGELDLGTWQSVLLVECDGPRTRTIRLYSD